MGVDAGQDPEAVDVARHEYGQDSEQVGGEVHEAEGGAGQDSSRLDGCGREDAELHQVQSADRGERSEAEQGEGIASAEMGDEANRSGFGCPTRTESDDLVAASNPGGYDAQAADPPDRTNFDAHPKTSCDGL